MHLTSDNVDPRKSSPWRCALPGLVVMLFSLSSFPATADSAPAGRVLTGSVQATSKDHPIQSRKVIGGETFMSTETLSTQDGHAVIGFSDGTKVTLRPNTELVITAYHYGYGRGEAAFYLNKSGIKVSTGKIAENNPSKFLISTPYGDLMLPNSNIKDLTCAEGCEYDAGLPKGRDSYAGRVAFSKGKVTIIRGDHAPTTVNAGDTLKKGNTIEVGREDLAVLVLADGQRKTLKPSESYTLK